jgi:hypothetical protein
MIKRDLYFSTNSVDLKQPFFQNDFLHILTASRKPQLSIII